LVPVHPVNNVEIHNIIRVMARRGKRN